MIRILVARIVDGGDIFPIHIIEDSEGEATDIIDYSGAESLFSHETENLVPMNSKLSIVKCQVQEDDPDYLDILSCTLCSEEAIKALYQ